MAINIEGSSTTRSGLVPLVVGVVVVIALIVLTYFVFFSQAPLVEVLAPQELETISEISAIEIDPKTVLNSPEYTFLDSRTSEPDLSGLEFGRENPFDRF